MKVDAGIQAIQISLLVARATGAVQTIEECENCLRIILNSPGTELPRSMDVGKPTRANSTPEG